MALTFKFNDMPRKKNIWYSMSWRIEVSDLEFIQVKGKYKVHDKQSPFNCTQVIENYITLDLLAVCIGSESFTFEEMCIDMSRFILRYEDQLVKPVREHFNK